MESLYPLVRVDGSTRPVDVPPQVIFARMRRFSVAWMAFFLGIGVTLAANVAAVPALVWKPAPVAGWPPVARLLSAELFAHRSSERFQRCLSSVRMAAAIDVIRFKLHRDTRKIRQDFRRAIPRSTGARAWASATCRRRPTSRWTPSPSSYTSRSPTTATSST
jgi:hypothetical protein